MKKKILLCSVALVTALGAVAAISTNSSKVFKTFANDGAEWHHYAKVDATQTQKGTREYWVQCGGSYTFTKPDVPASSIVDMTTAPNTAEFTANDDRYIFPMTLPAQDVFMDAETKSIDLTGYTLKAPLRAGNFNLGSDPTNLDVSGFRTTHEDDGVKSLTTYATKDGKYYKVFMQTTFVTKAIATMSDLDVLYEQTPTTTVWGYYTLANDIDMKDGQMAGRTSATNQAYGFRGTFDGRGHTITNYAPTWKPIFGMIGYNALVKDVNFTNVSFQQGYQHGILSRTASKATFHNINIGLKSVTAFSGHEGLKSQQSGMIAGAGTGQVNTYNNITVDARGQHLFGILGIDMRADTYQNFNVYCKDYDVLGYSDKTTEVTSVPGVTVTLDPVIEEIAADPVALDKSQDTGSYTLPAAYADVTVADVKIDGTEISLGSNLASLNLASVRSNASVIGEKYLVITGTRGGAAAQLKAKVVFADKVVTTSDELKAAVNDNVLDNTKKTGYIALGNDVTTASTYGEDVNCSWNDGFAGTFNGMGHTITMPAAATRGIFNVCNGCTVLNTKFVATNMVQSWGKHILAQRVTNTTIKNCQFEYSIASTGTWDAQGGVVCAQQGGGPSTIQNCTFTNTGTEAAKLVWGFASNSYALTSYVKMSGCSVSGATEHFGVQTTGSNVVTAITDYWDFSASASGQLVKYVAPAA